MAYPVWVCAFVFIVRARASSRAAAIGSSGQVELAVQESTSPTAVLDNDRSNSRSGPANTLAALVRSERKAARVTFPGDTKDVDNGGDPSNAAATYSFWDPHPEVGNTSGVDTLALIQSLREMGDELVGKT